MANLSGYFNSNEAIEIDNTKWYGNIYYLTGIVIPPGRKFNVRVPNGDGTLIGFNFSVDASTEEATIIEDTTTR